MTYTERYTSVINGKPLYPAIQVSMTATAVGDDSHKISNAYDSFIRDFFVPVSRESLFPMIKFYRLKSQWEAETPFTSSVLELSTHPAYQQIIGMGKDVLPFIITELRKEPGHWFWALKSITGEDPVPPDHRGKMKLMTGDWMAWAKERGYVG